MMIDSERGIRPLSQSSTNGVSTNAMITAKMKGRRISADQMSTPATTAPLIARKSTRERVHPGPGPMLVREVLIVGVGMEGAIQRSVGNTTIGPAV